MPADVWSAVPQLQLVMPSALPKTMSASRPQTDIGALAATNIATKTTQIHAVHITVSGAACYLCPHMRSNSWIQKLAHMETCHICRSCHGNGWTRTNCKARLMESLTGEAMASPAGPTTAS